MEPAQGALRHELRASRRSWSAPGPPKKDVERQFRQNLLREKVFAKLSDGINADDKEVADFYKKNEKRYQEPEKVKASHILLKSNARMAPPERDKAKARADEALEEGQGRRRLRDRREGVQRGQHARSRRRPRLLHQGSDGEAVRRCGLAGEGRRGHRSGRDAVRLPHHQEDRSPEGAEASARRGEGADSPLAAGPQAQPGDPRRARDVAQGDEDRAADQGRPEGPLAAPTDVRTQAQADVEEPARGEAAAAAPTTDDKPSGK